MIIQHLKKIIPNGNTASLEEITEAEKKLGFKLPCLLKELYQNVANGHKQLPQSIIGLKGGYTEDFEDIVTWYLTNISCNNEPDMPDWKENMLAIADLGCCEYICLDCSTKEANVWQWDGNQYEDDKPETIEDCWINLNLTFEKWIKREIEQNNREEFENS